MRDIERRDWSLTSSHKMVPINVSRALREDIGIWCGCTMGGT